MKHRLLEWLRLPHLLGALRLEVFQGDDEVEEGCLDCAGCGRTFPVIDGMPRLLPDELVHVVPRFHDGFFRRYVGPSVIP